MYVMLTLLGILPVLIAGQVLRLGLVQNEDLREQGEQQSTAYVEIPALRGAILDRAGRTLAVDVERYDVTLDPTATGFASNEALFFERLSELLRLPVGEIGRRVRGRRSPKFVLLMRNSSLSASQRDEVSEIPGIRVNLRFARRYNYPTTASHLLGHVDADQKGLAGLEKTYERYLRGIAGSQAAQRDRRGVRKVIAGGAVVDPLHGESIVLTIDLVRQTILEEELARGVSESGARWGTAIAMDPTSGAIMALANVPTYDSNRPGAVDAQSRRNHAVTDRLEPGSTFKLVAAVTAIETGVIAMEDTVDTGPGWIVQYGRTLRDTHPHGRIPFSEVISLSSNVGVSLVAERLDPGSFYQYARNLGFGHMTGIDLPGEVSGRLKKPSTWSRPSLSAMSRGYEIEASPLQVLVAYSALANGGVLVRPYLVSERRDVTGRTTWRVRKDSVRRAFRRETVETLMPAFEAVVNEGTATTARIDGLRIAGKTGTAQKVKNGRYAAGAYRATFVGFFPVEDPQVAMIVVMDEPKSSIYGGTVSAPVFRRTAIRWLATLPSLAARFRAVDEEAGDAPALGPDVSGPPAAVAGRSLESPGLRTWSGRQIKDSDDASRMPDLRGFGSRAASYVLASRGVRVRFEGQGKVVSQWPEAGADLPAEAVLRCR